MQVGWSAGGSSSSSHAARVQAATQSKADIRESALGSWRYERNVFQAACEGDTERLTELLVTQQSGPSEDIVDDGGDATHLVDLSILNSVGQPDPQWGDQFAKRHHFTATALSYACAYGRVEAVELLLRLGAQKNILSSTGWTCVDYAKRRGYTHILSLLEASGGKEA